MGEGFLFSGGVRVDREGWTATTERARYFPGEGRLSSDSAVEIVSEGIVVEGSGFEADLEESRFRITSEVRARIEGAVE